jgi:hypothetical protein
MCLKRYYKKHLRSLMISKFFLSSSYAIPIIESSYLSLGFKKEKIEFGLAYLLLFYMAQSSSKNIFGFTSIRGKKRIKLKSINVTLSLNKFYVFVEKCSSIYLINYES